VIFGQFWVILDEFLGDFRKILVFFERYLVTLIWQAVFLKRVGKKSSARDFGQRKVNLD
jgi:hypothetical protein